MKAAGVVGGSLKRLEEADGESLCAEWWPVKAVLDERVPLRQVDILCSVRIGWEAYRKTGEGRASWSELGTPWVTEPSPALVYRLLLSRGGEREALVSGSDGALPSVAIPLGVWKGRYYVVQKLRGLLGEAAESRVAPPVVVSLRSSLGPDSHHAGLAFTLLFRIRDRDRDGTSEEPQPPPPFVWLPLQEPVAAQLRRLKSTAAPYYFK